MARLNSISLAARGALAAGAIWALAGCADQGKGAQGQATAPPASTASTGSTATTTASTSPGTGTPATAPAPAAAPAAMPEVHDEKSLVFYDSDVFDLSFADTLKSGSDQIDVNFAGPTSLNSFPARMNVWLAEVKKSDGEVTVVDPNHTTQTRGLFGVGIIFDLIDAISTMQERKAQSDRLALVHPYNAEIIYDATSGTAREVKFTRRTPTVAPTAPGTTGATGPAPITGAVPTTSGN